MIEVTLNTKSNYTEAPHVYMYNKGQTLHIIGDLPENCEAHFALSTDHTYIVNTATITPTSDGGTAAIPDFIFSTESRLSNGTYPFYVYLYEVEGENSGYTFHQIKMTVKERPCIESEEVEEIDG